MEATHPAGDEWFGLALTVHAQERMTARRLSRVDVAAALTYGRRVHVRGAEIRAIGRREVRKFQRRGLNLTPYEGVQVVCSPDGHVLTASRNRDFRGLRPGYLRR